MIETYFSLRSTTGYSTDLELLNIYEVKDDNESHMHICYVDGCEEITYFNFNETPYKNCYDVVITWYDVNPTFSAFSSSLRKYRMYQIKIRMFADEFGCSIL